MGCSKVKQQAQDKTVQRCEFKSLVLPIVVKMAMPTWAGFFKHGLETSCLFMLSIMWHYLCYGTAPSEVPSHTLNSARASSLILLVLPFYSNCDQSPLRYAGSSLTPAKCSGHRQCFLQCSIKHRIITNSYIKQNYLSKLSEQGFTLVCGLVGDFFLLFFLPEHLKSKFEINTLTY